MLELAKKIEEERIKSLKLKQIYLGNNKISYEKSKELMKQQNDSYKKMEFFKKLQKEMGKNNEK